MNVNVEIDKPTDECSSRDADITNSEPTDTSDTVQNGGNRNGPTTERQPKDVTQTVPPRPGADHHGITTENVNTARAESDIAPSDVRHVRIDIENSAESGGKTASPPSNDGSSAQILVDRPLCADYQSSSDSSDTSDSESDSDSDSSDSESDSCASCESDSSSSSAPLSCGDVPMKITKQKQGKDKKSYLVDEIDLPPIENLSISVPEEECQEVGVVSSIVDALVVVRAYKDTPALNLDTVLFAEKGQKCLGKIFDVFGPVTEPAYAIRYNSAKEIAENDITQGMKVYCAPKTEYTTFVFVSELMKMKGSDASWENNEEAPPECQDFSDDEEEQKFRRAARKTDGAAASAGTESKSRKRAKVFHPRPDASNYRNPFAGSSRPPRHQQHAQFPRGGSNPFCYPRPSYQPRYPMTSHPYPRPQGTTPPRFCHPQQGMNYYPGYVQPYSYPQYNPPPQFYPGQGLPPPPPPPPPGVYSNQEPRPGERN